MVFGTRELTFEEGTCGLVWFFKTEKYGISKLMECKKSNDLDVNSMTSHNEETSCRKLNLASI